MHQLECEIVHVKSEMMLSGSAPGKILNDLEYNCNPTQTFDMSILAGVVALACEKINPSMQSRNELMQIEAAQFQTRDAHICSFS